jgi:hypothetical protein
MQQFDASGRLQETIDFFSVGFLTSRLRRDIRSLMTENNNNHPNPNLIMTREMTRAAALNGAAPGKHEREAAALAGAAAWDMHDRCRVAGAAHAAVFWTDGRCWKAMRNGEGMYSIAAEDSATDEARWSWTRNTRVNDPAFFEFDKSSWC